jgi:hypothetical protein
MREMQNPASSNDQLQGSNNPFATYLRDPRESNQPRGPLAAWYRYTSPPEPPSTASYKRKDTYRRGQLASTIMLALQIILFIIMPIGLFGPNKQIFITAIFLTVIVIITAIFNRFGRVNIAGLILSLSLNLGICLSILRSPHGLAPDSIAQFDLLVFSELFVASLLPVNWVWLSALFNIAFSIYELTYAPRTPLMQEVMSTSYYAILSRPIQLHLLVTVVLFLWVVNANRAIRRADRAEEIARLEHDIAQQNKAIKEQKQQLDYSIEQIVKTLMRWSNGETGVRIVFNRENVLWQVTGAINNLLGRVQRSRQESMQLQQTTDAINRFYETRNRTNDGMILDWARTNTPVDTLVMQHNAHVQRMAGARIAENSPTSLIRKVPPLQTFADERENWRNHDFTLPEQSQP